MATPYFKNTVFLHGLQRCVRILGRTNHNGQADSASEKRSDVYINSVLLWVRPGGVLFLEGALIDAELCTPIYGQMGRLDGVHSMDGEIHCFAFANTFDAWVILMLKYL